MQTLIFSTNPHLFNRIDIAPINMPPSAYPYHPYWSATGIFHYVFEAYFENRHQYFQDRCAFNIGGKIAAAAHTYYYIDQLKVHNRGLTYNDQGEIRVDDDLIIHLTNRTMMSALKSSNLTYTDEMLCGIPYRFRTSEMEDLANKHWRRIKDEPVAANEEAKRYKNSIGLESLLRLYSWGYREAKEMFPFSLHNSRELNHFINQFKTITQLDHEELASQYSQIEFHVVKGADLKWSAYFIRRKDHKEVSYKHFLK
jgi:hypothetical protein